MQRIHDIGLPNWPALLVDDTRVVVVGHARTIGGYHAAWLIATLACVACCAAITWFAFGYALRTVDWYGNYTIAPERSDIWLAVIVSVVAMIGLPFIFRRVVIQFLASLFTTRHVIQFDADVVRIPGVEVIPRRDELGRPIEVQFWVMPHEQLKRQAAETTNRYMKSIYAEAYLLVATVQSSVGRRRIALGVILTDEGAGNFASVCNAANSLVAGSSDRNRNYRGSNGGDIRDLPM